MIGTAFRHCVLHYVYINLSSHLEPLLLHSEGVILSKYVVNFPNPRLDSDFSYILPQQPISNYVIPTAKWKANSCYAVLLYPQPDCDWNNVFSRQICSEEAKNRIFRHLQVSVETTLYNQKRGWVYNTHLIWIQNFLQQESLKLKSRLLKIGFSPFTNVMIWNLKTSKVYFWPREEDYFCCHLVEISTSNDFDIAEFAKGKVYRWYFLLSTTTNQAKVKEHKVVSTLLEIY